jgi:hypothetical protein
MSMERRLENPERLGGLGSGRQRTAPSWTEQEAHALDAEIREIEEQLKDLGADPDEWRRGDERMGLPLDEHIAALEKEIHDDDDH